MLDAREPLPVGADGAGVRLHHDQSAVSDERHASAAHQTAPELDQPGSDRRAESRQGRADTDAVVRHTLHTHTVPSHAQDHRRTGLSDILRRAGVHPSEFGSKGPR